MTAVYLLLSTFALVFCLGLQSQLVRDGHFWAVAANSLCIGSANLVMLKLAPNASVIEMAAYLTGGPAGIVASMIFYKRIKQ